MNHLSLSVDGMVDALRCRPIPALLFICCVVWGLPLHLYAPPHLYLQDGHNDIGVTELLEKVKNVWKCIRSLSLITMSPSIIQFSSVQSFSRVQLFATPWMAACQASLSITNSWNLLKLTSIVSVMPSNHLILCHLLLLLPSIFPSIRVFSNESVLCIWWPKYWSFRFSISPSNEYSGLISFRMDWLDLLAVLASLVLSLADLQLWPRKCIHIIRMRDVVPDFDRVRV